jgi:hypothetical protein
VEEATRRAAKFESKAKTLMFENDKLKADLVQYRARDYTPGQVVDAIVDELNALVASLTNPNAKAKVAAAVNEAMTVVGPGGYCPSLDQTHVESWSLMVHGTP